MKYRAKLSFGSYERVCSPDLLATNRLDQKLVAEYVFQESLASPIRFGGLDAIKKADFEFLYAIENSTNRCDAILFKLEKRLPNGEYENRWNGYFSASDCKWNLDLCTAEVQVKPDDELRCLFDNYGVDHNIIRGLPLQPVTVNLKLKEQIEFKFIPGGELQYQEDSDTWKLFLVGRWWVKGHMTFIGIREKGYRMNEDIIYRITTTRSFVNGEAPNLTGDGWRLIDENAETKIAKYAKAPDIYQFEPFQINSWVELFRHPEELSLVPCGTAYDATKYLAVQQISPEITCPVFPETEDDTRKWLLLWRFGTVQFKRGFRLVDVFRDLMARTCPALEPVNPSQLSTFFTSSVNYVTDKANKLIDLVILQKSDVIKYRSTEVASRGLISVKKMLDALRFLFDVHWFIGEDGKIRLEHRSYFTPDGVVDLTQPQFAEYTRNTNSYEYEKVKMPRFERLTLAEFYNQEFGLAEIEYSGLCVTYGEGEDTEEKNVAGFATDIEGILLSGGDFSKSGFVLLQHTNGVSDMEPGVSDLRPIPNGHLSLANLVKRYQLENRVLESGKLNGSPILFNSVRKTKKQVTITIPACKLSGISLFSTFKTKLGEDGQLASSSLSLANDTVSLNIIYSPGGAHLKPSPYSGTFDRSFDKRFD